MTPDDLTARRQALGLSVNGLGRALGMTGGAVSRWERGQRAIPPWLDLALQTLERNTPEKQAAWRAVFERLTDD